MTLYGVELVRCADAEEVASVVGDELVAAARAGRSIVLTGGHRRAGPTSSQPSASPTGAPPRSGGATSAACRPRTSSRTSGSRARTCSTGSRRRRARCSESAASSAPTRRRASTTSSCARRGSTTSCSGIGPDGHTASLFPGPADAPGARAARDSGGAKLEPFVERVTLTIPVLCSAPEVVFIVTGEAKAEAVERAFARPPGPGDARQPDPLGRRPHARGRRRRCRIPIACLDSGGRPVYTAAWPPPSPSRSWTS